MAMRYRADIDGLRALAVGAVLLFHLGVAGVPGGFVGVDIFFVISGFLITKIIVREISDETYSTINFYERRIRRIVPAFSAMTVAVAFFGLVLMLPDDLSSLGGSICASSSFISNFYFWQESGDYFAGPSELKPMLHTWSLAVEEQFYIVFPLVLIVLYRIKIWRFALPILICAAFASFALSVYGTQHYSVATFYLLPTRAWELLAGAIVAFRDLPLPRRRLIIEIGSHLSLALMLYPIFFYTSSTPFPGLNASPPVAGAALFLYIGAGDAQSSIHRLASTTPMRSVGLISYSLYLWHWPVIVFFKYYFLDLTAAQSFAALALSIVLAGLSWRYIEQPFRQKRRETRPVLYIAAGALSVAMFSVAGAVLWITGGLPGRVPAEIVAMADKGTYRGPWRECGGAFATRKTPSTVCVLGDKTKAPDFILTGDSHANALAAALFQSANSVNRSGVQITDTGYRPTLGYEKFGEQEKYRYLNKLLINYLDTHPQIKDVVVAIYWRQAVQTDRYLNARGGIEEGDAAIERGLQALIERYPTKNFLFVQSTANSPTFGGAVAARAKWYGWQFNPSVPVNDVVTMQARYEGIIDRLTRIGNVHVLKLTSRLCDESVCRGFVDGHPAYADDNHLAYEASKLFDPDFRNFLSMSAPRQQSRFGGRGTCDGCIHQLNVNVAQ